MQREKEAALMRILKLEEQLDNKQALELEIQQLKGKLQVMKHMESDDDSVKKKMEEMNEELEEKMGEMEGLESLNQALLVKERRSNDELQAARKELIFVCIHHSFKLAFKSSYEGAVPILLCDKFISTSCSL